MKFGKRRFHERSGNKSRIRGQSLSLKPRMYLMTFVVQRWDECARAPGMQCVSVGPAALIDASEQLNCKYLNKHVFSVFFIRAMTVGMPLQCL